REAYDVARGEIKAGSAGILAGEFPGWQRVGKEAGAPRFARGRDHPRNSNQDQIEQTKLFHRHTSSVAQKTGERRRAPARYTLRALREEGSDQQGAIPAEKRNARCG